MKTLLLACLCWICTRPTASYAQLDSISATVSVSAHPRILLRQGEEQALYQAIQADTNLRLVHHILLSQCDSLLFLKKSALNPWQVGRMQPTQVREALRRLFALAYGWRLTKRQDYWARAKHELMQVLILTHWNRERPEDLAEITTAASIAYDWLYTGFTPREHSMIQERIIEKGLLAALAPRDSSWQVPTEYQQQLINTGLVYGALAIYEAQPTLARSILNRSIRSTKQLLTLYEPNGAYPYGYSAWSHATGFTALLISALQKEFKFDFGLWNQGGFSRTAEYGLHMRAPSGNSFNYGESALDAPISPVQSWLANLLVGGDSYSGWSQLVSKAASHWQREALLPALLVWSYGQSRTPPTQIPNRVWVGRGKTPVALLRSAWNDSTALFVGLKAGTPSLTNAQMDVGSFVAEAQGVRWAIDLGGQNTDSLALAGVNMQLTDQNASRWLVFRHSAMSHNTLVVNYGPQLVKGFAPIVSYSNQEPFLNAITDLTSLYSNALVSVQRGVAIVAGRSIRIQDEVETGSKETTIRWAFVTGAQVELIDARRAVLSQAGKKLTVILDPGSGLSWRTWSTGPRYEYDSGNPGTVQLGFETTIPSQTKRSWQIQLVAGSDPASTSPPLVPLAQWPHD